MPKKFYEIDPRSTFTITAVINVAEMIDNVTYFHPSLIFEDNPGRLPLEWSHIDYFFLNFCDLGPMLQNFFHNL
jgi:hypothetical protein